MLAALLVVIFGGTLPALAACVESVVPDRITVAATGGTVNAVLVQREDVQTPDFCDQQDAATVVETSVPWITIPPQSFAYTEELSGNFYIFRTPFFLNVQPNLSASPRQGVLRRSLGTAAGATVLAELTITQSGLSVTAGDCLYTILPTSQLFLISGGSGAIGIITADGCPWTAVSEATFLTIAEGASGTGRGTVKYTVAANSTPSGRSGTITIAGKTFTVLQPGSLPFFRTRPESVKFRFLAGGAPPEAQFVSLQLDGSGLLFSATASTTSGGNWLSVNPPAGLAPSSVAVSVDPGNLPPGIYNGAVTVRIPNADPATRTVAVELQVDAPGPPDLDVRPDNLRFSFSSGADARRSGLLVINEGGDNLSFTAAEGTASGGNWLSVTPESGTATLAAPVPLLVTVDPRGLAPGTYVGRIRVTSPSDADGEDIPVTMTISAAEQILLLSQRGLTFTAITDGSALPPRRFAVLNLGSGTLNWSASSSTFNGGPNWLQVTPATGTAQASLSGAGRVEVSVNPAGLTAGEYYGQVQVSSPTAANSPQVLSVVLRLLPAGSDPGTRVEPTGLIFTGTAGGLPPAPQTISLSNITSNAKSFRLGQFTVDGDPWLSSLSAVVGSIPPGQPADVLLPPVTLGLTPGVRRGVLNIQLDDGSEVSVSVLLVLTPPAATPQRGLPRPASSHCTPAQLLPVFTLLANQFVVPAGWPTPVEVRVVDDCGDPLVSGAVLVTFSNGDPPLGLTSLGDGRWSGTWQARNLAAEQIIITATAEVPGTTLQGAAQLLGGVQENSNIPQVFAGGVVSAASFAPQIPAGPGSLISIFGTKLSQATGQAGSLPLETQLQGTSALLAGQSLPLLFSSDGQVNAMVPYDVPVDSEQQLVVLRGSASTVPEPVTVAAAQPAVFTVNQSGAGQGIIMVAGLTLADASAPAKAGDVVVIWCAGLGAVNPPVAAGAAAPGEEPLARTVNPVTVTIGGQDAPVQFSGLAPGFAGLYQVNAEVPAGITPGNEVPVVLRVAGQDSPTVTMAVQ